jgi:formylglycine-generating enzyme required for sulfatase activity
MTKRRLLTRRLVVRFIILVVLFSSVCLHLLSQSKRPELGSNKNSGSKKTSSGNKKSQPKPSPTPLPPLNTYVFKTVTVREGGTITARDIVEINGPVKSFVQEIGGVSFEMVEIPEGVFQMGTDETLLTQAIRECELRCKDDGCRASCDKIIRAESPQHQVTVRKFFISRYEVTQAQWNAIRQLDTIKFKLPPNPSSATHDPTQDGDRPVEQVTWTQAKEFCRLLSQKTGRTYRLPTEAEWEYSCRADTQTPFGFGIALSPNFVNYDAGSINRRTTLPVRIREYANKFGLYDMHGNVAEWCEDSWHDNYVNNPPRDGTAWIEKRKISQKGVKKAQGSTGSFRVVRGGSWQDAAYACRCAARKQFIEGGTNSGLGFRIVFDPR